MARPSAFVVAMRKGRHPLGLVSPMLRELAVWRGETLGARGGSQNRGRDGTSALVRHAHAVGRGRHRRRCKAAVHGCGSGSALLSELQGGSEGDCGASGFAASLGALGWPAVALRSGSAKRVWFRLWMVGHCTSAHTDAADGDHGFSTNSTPGRNTVTKSTPHQQIFGTMSKLFRHSFDVAWTVLDNFEADLTRIRDYSYIDSTVIRHYIDSRSALIRHSFDDQSNAP